MKTSHYSTNSRNPSLQSKDILHEVAIENGWNFVSDDFPLSHVKYVEYGKGSNFEVFRILPTKIVAVRVGCEFDFHDPRSTHELSEYFKKVII